MTASTYLQVAIDVPLRRTFDYLPPAGVAAARLVPGIRVRVPFGRRDTIGVLLAVKSSTDVPGGRLRRAEALLDEQALLPARMLALLDWAARYYQHPIGEVVATAMPQWLRAGRAARAPRARSWRLTPAGAGVDTDALCNRAPRQAQLLRRLAAAGALDETDLLADAPGGRATLRRLTQLGLVAVCEPAVAVAVAVSVARAAGPPLNAAQEDAGNAVIAALGAFQPFLLEGVTGSGKTEVYLAVAAAALARDRQVLVLVPEIGLTDQIVQRFRLRFGAAAVVVLHSGLSERERFTAWAAAGRGQASVVIGTRSAVWTTFPRLGVVIVDEEHDLAYKQQDGFRYNARDVAVMRARDERVPVVLGTATPALETLHNARQGRYRRLLLPERGDQARCTDPTSRGRTASPLRTTPARQVRPNRLPHHS